MKESEFWDFANNWYQRTHRLREISEDENETPERRSKALKLFGIMLGRVLKVASIGANAQIMNASTRFKPGGFTPRNIP